MDAPEKIIMYKCPRCFWWGKHNQALWNTLEETLICPKCGQYVDEYVCRPARDEKKEKMK